MDNQTLSEFDVEAAKTLSSLRTPPTDHWSNGNGHSTALISTPANTTGNDSEPDFSVIDFITINTINTQPQQYVLPPYQQQQFPLSEQQCFQDVQDAVVRSNSSSGFHTSAVDETCVAVTMNYVIMHSNSVIANNCIISSL